MIRRSVIRESRRDRGGVIGVIAFARRRGRVLPTIVGVRGFQFRVPRPGKREAILPLSRDRRRAVCPLDSHAVGDIGIPLLSRVLRRRGLVGSSGPQDARRRIVRVPSVLQTVRRGSFSSLRDVRRGGRSQFHIRRDHVGILRAVQPDRGFSPGQISQVLEALPARRVFQLLERRSNAVQILQTVVAALRTDHLLVHAHLQQAGGLGGRSHLLIEARGGIYRGRPGMRVDRLRRTRVALLEANSSPVGIRVARVRRVDSGHVARILTETLLLFVSSGRWARLATNVIRRVLTIVRIAGRVAARRLMVAPVRAMSGRSLLPRRLTRTRLKVHRPRLNARVRAFNLPWRFQSPLRSSHLAVGQSRRRDVHHPLRLLVAVGSPSRDSTRRRTLRLRAVLPPLELRDVRQMSALFVQQRVELTAHHVLRYGLLPHGGDQQFLIAYHVGCERQRLLADRPPIAITRARSPLDGLGATRLVLRRRRPIRILKASLTESNVPRIARLTAVPPSRRRLTMRVLPVRHAIRRLHPSIVLRPRDGREIHVTVEILPTDGRVVASRRRSRSIHRHVLRRRHALAGNRQRDRLLMVIATRPRAIVRLSLLTEHRSRQHLLYVRAVLRLLIDLPR